MKTFKKLTLFVLISVLFANCDNFFHDLVPPDGDRILLFEIPDQVGDSVIGENSVTFAVKQDADIFSMLPKIKVSPRAEILPLTIDYLKRAFPSADIEREALAMSMTSDISFYVWNLIERSPDFTVPDLTIPLDFSRPVDFLVISAKGTARKYSASIGNPNQLGEASLTALSFSKYDNPEIITSANCAINNRAQTVSVLIKYPMEMPDLSFALVPSFEIWGEKLEIDGAEIHSGQDAIQFNPSFGAQTKIITVTLGNNSTDYMLNVVFAEDPDSIRSIIDFRFTKADNPEIAVDAVAAIVNNGAAGTITIQVFYSGAKPVFLTPCFITPGTVSMNGFNQTSGAGSLDFSSPLEYRVVSKSGQFSRVYTVKTEYFNLTTDTPRILTFTFPRALNSGLVADASSEISDDAGSIRAIIRYGGSFATDTLTPEFTAEGLVSVSGSVQISGASLRDFSRQVKYTVTHPANDLLKRDYMVDCQFVRDTSADATIAEFGFYPEDNIGLSESLPAKIDHDNGRITLIAPIGSGVTARVMIPRFVSAGQVTVNDEIQYSGFSGRLFDAPIIYTVVSANGMNRKEYTVDVRELGTTIYVNPAATGQNNGLNWNDAFMSLQAACEAATLFLSEVPKEIWIAKGTYKPGNTTDDFFQVAPNTSYIGGFAGNETSKSQRNVSANKVTISGNLTKGMSNNIQAAFFSRTMLMTDEDVYFEDIDFENFMLNEKAAPGFIYNPISIRWSSRALGNLTILNCNFKAVNGPCVETYNGTAHLKNIKTEDVASVYHDSKAVNEKNLLTIDRIENIEVKNQIPYGNSGYDPIIVIHGGEFAASALTINDIKIENCSLGIQIYGGASEMSINNINVTNVNTEDKQLGNKGSVLEIYGSTRLSVSNVQAENITNGRSFIGTVFISEPRGNVFLDTVTIKNVTVTNGDLYGGAGGIAVNWAYGGVINRGNRVEMKNISLENIDCLFLPALGVYKPETDVYFDNVSVTCNTTVISDDYYDDYYDDIEYLIYLISRGRYSGGIGIHIVNFNSLVVNKMHAEALTGENVIFTAGSNQSARIDVSDFTARKTRFSISGSGHTISIKDFKGANNGEIGISSSTGEITAERIAATYFSASYYTKLNLDTATIDGYLYLYDYTSSSATKNTNLNKVVMRDLDTSKDVRLYISCRENLTITDSTLVSRARTLNTYTNYSNGSPYSYASNRGSISLSPPSLADSSVRSQGVFNNVTFDFYTVPSVNYYESDEYVSYINASAYSSDYPTRGNDLKFTDCRFIIDPNSDPSVIPIHVNTRYSRTSNTYYGTSTLDLNNVSFTNYPTAPKFKLMELNRNYSYRISGTSSYKGTPLNTQANRNTFTNLVRLQNNANITWY